MDIARLAIGAGILGIAVYGLWWLARRAQSLPTAKPDALAKIAAFDLIVATIHPGTTDVIEACALIRAQLAEKLMPMGSDAE